MARDCLLSFHPTHTFLMWQLTDAQTASVLGSGLREIPTFLIWQLTDAQTASVLGSGLREIPRLPSRAGSYIRRSMSWSLAAGLPTSDDADDDNPPRPESAVEIRCYQHDYVYTAAAYYCQCYLLLIFE